MLLMMRGLCSHRMTLCAQGLHRGRLMLMMRGLCEPRFTQRPTDAHDARPLFTQNDARPLWAQVYTEAG